MIHNYLIAGVGGQGTVLASNLIAEAAMRLGYDVRTTETIGMAQRGGSVVSHLRLSRVNSGTIHSPLIPPGTACALIAFEPAEAVRNLPFLSSDGRLIVCDSPIKPVTDALSKTPYNSIELQKYLKTNFENTIIIRGQPIKDYSAKTLNVALLGAAAQAGVFPFSADDLQAVISDMRKFREQNLKSFKMGKDLYNEYINK